MIHPKLTINCRGRLIDLTDPIVMGILNINDDSFFSGSRFTEKDALVEAAGKMLEQGARILDVGGMSSRPGARVISVADELNRVIPAISEILRVFPEAILSIDTVHGPVAREAVAAGASLINDISAGSLDPDLFSALAELRVPYILMHMQHRPENMQEAPAYGDVVQEVLDFLIGKVDELRQLGLVDIIIDPGFGFGKSLTHNYDLLRALHLFRILDVPILVGLSRKSMIYKPLGLQPETALNGTTALHVIALQQGARILRVHDVAPAIEVIKLWKMITDQNTVY